MMHDPLSHRVHSTPNALALVDAHTGEEWTYDELDTAVETVAGQLAALGVEPGEFVGVLQETSVEAIVTVHAILRRGARFVGLNVRQTPGELESKAERVGIDALLCESRTVETALDIGMDAPAVSIDDAGDVAALDTLDGVEPESVERPSWSLDDPQVVLFTSGTTGEPKPVPLTAGNLLASAGASAFRLGVVPEDRWLLALPIYHMGGLAPVLRSTLYGTAVVVHEGFDPEDVASATREYDATGISLVPTQLRRIFEADATLSGSLRFVLLGGAAAPGDLIEACEERGVPIHPTYGMTETASQVATATPGEAFERPGTVGRPLLGIDVVIVDEDGDELPADEVGEIVVSGSTLTPGYLGDTRADFDEHGFHTGDLGYRDEKGWLHVVGRVDDVIVTGGENVSGREIADVLERHSAVADAAVVGVPDPEWGERIAALVVPVDEESVTEDELRTFCRERLSGYKRPRSIEFAGSIPRTASGTIDREAVRDRLREPER